MRRRLHRRAVLATCSAAAFALSAATALAQDPSAWENRGLRVERVTSVRALEKALALGRIIDLGDVSHNRAARLAEVPTQGRCRPMTHWICGYSYYLVLSEGLAFPYGGQVWDLGFLGAVLDVSRAPSGVVGFADLILELQNWSGETLEAEPSLERKRGRVRLRIREDRVEISRVDGWEDDPASLRRTPAPGDRGPVAGRRPQNEE